MNRSFGASRYVQSIDPSLLEMHGGDAFAGYAATVNATEAVTTFVCPRRETLVAAKCQHCGSKALEKDWRVAPAVRDAGSMPPLVVFELPDMLRRGERPARQLRPRSRQRSLVSSQSSSAMVAT